MALATQCPHCHTTFRVAQDQLKLRAGLVRCGNCKEVFNGIEHLLRADAPIQAAPSPGNSPSQAAPASAPEPIQDHAAVRSAPVETAPEPETATEFIDFFDLIKKPAEPAPGPDAAIPASLEAEDDPLQRMTLIHLNDDESDPEEAATPDPDEASSATPRVAENIPDAPDPLDLAIENLQRKPSRNAKGSRTRQLPNAPQPGESDEPGFVKSARRRQRIDHTVGILMGLGTFVLLIGALAQGTYMLRNQIAARVPESMPYLAQACTMIGCRIGLPAQIDAITIESSELQSLTAKNTFLLSTLLRNRSQTAQSWPNIELTLNDAGDKVIARRVFVPRDYLPRGLEPSQGLVPASEQQLRVYFELADLKASGYRVYLFYA